MSYSEAAEAALWKDTRQLPVSPWKPIAAKINLFRGSGSEAQMFDPYLSAMFDLPQSWSQ